MEQDCEIKFHSKWPLIMLNKYLAVFLVGKQEFTCSCFVVVVVVVVVLFGSASEYMHT